MSSTLDASSTPSPPAAPDPSAPTTTGPARAAGPVADAGRERGGPLLPGPLRPAPMNCRGGGGKTSPRRGGTQTYGQPAANEFRKHPKSATVSTGGVVLPSQLA